MDVELLNLYSDMIRSIEQRQSVGMRKSKDLTLQYFSRGPLYNGELMMVGRAVNGWLCKWQHGEYKDQPTEQLKCFLQKAHEKDSTDPLQWVIDLWPLRYCDDGKRCYQTAKSAFWQLARRLSHELVNNASPEDTNWPLRLAWSNLYKIAPNVGGNPGGKLILAQRNHCKEILRYEIEQCKPKHIVFVTGCDWFEPFRSVVSQVCRQTGSEYVVCPRPERKPLQPIADVILHNLSRGWTGCPPVDDSE